MSGIEAGCGDNTSVASADPPALNEETQAVPPQSANDVDHTAVVVDPAGDASVGEESNLAKGERSKWPEKAGGMY